MYLKCILFASLYNFTKKRVGTVKGLQIELFIGGVAAIGDGADGDDVHIAVNVCRAGTGRSQLKKDTKR